MEADGSLKAISDKFFAPDFEPPVAGLAADAAPITETRQAPAWRVSRPDRREEQP